MMFPSLHLVFVPALENLSWERTALRMNMFESTTFDVITDTNFSNWIWTREEKDFGKFNISGYHYSKYRIKLYTILYYENYYLIRRRRKVTERFILKLRRYLCIALNGIVEGLESSTVEFHQLTKQVETALYDLLRLGVFIDDMINKVLKMM